MPTAAPLATAATSPTAIMASLPSMIFMATALARPILAGSERSTLPGPSVMTNIWPMPTITMKTASDRPGGDHAAGTLPSGEDDGRKPDEEGAGEGPDPGLAGEGGRVRHR